MDKDTIFNLTKKSSKGNAFLMLAVLAFSIGLSYTASLLKKRIRL